MKFNATCRGLLAAVLALGATGEIASAQTPVTVPNFSFESTNGDLITTAGGNAGQFNVGTFWICNDTGGGVYVVNFNPNGVDFTNAISPSLLPPSGDGTNYLVEDIAAAPACFPVCWQDLGALLPNTTYALTIAIGQTMVGTTNSLIATGQGMIALVNGPTAFYPVLGATFVDNSLQAPGTFVDFTLVVTTPSVVSGDLTIVMRATNGAQICFDNVRLTTTPAANPTALLPSLSNPAANPTAVPAAPAASETVYVGSVVTLGELAAGTSPFTYQWQSDNGSGGATFTSISLATNANYVLTNTAVAGPVEYQVIVTNSLGAASTSTPVTLAVIQGPPVLVQDTLPSGTPSDMAGSAVTFSVVFDGDRPVSYQWQVDYLQGFGPGPIAGTTVNGTTNATLTLTNLQVSDSGIYSCVATNDQSVLFGQVTSTGSYLIVHPLPAADSYGVIQSQAVQEGFGNNTLFNPSWVFATNSLIAGVQPIATDTNHFRLFGCFGTNILTDGSFGTITPAAAGEVMATMGNPQAAGAAGSYVTYLLPTNANGWDITNIVIYGGWTDNGRDQQSINILYSTIAAPATFNSEVTLVNFLPNAPAAVQVAARSTLTSGTATPAMVHNVAAIQFNTSIQAGGYNENGWEGYAEFQVFGTPSAPAPVWVTNMVPATGADVEGGSVTLSCVASYSLPLTYTWTAVYADGHGTGPVTGTAPGGTTSSNLTLVNLQLSDSGTYTLTATNTTARTGLVSLPCAFLVNQAPTPDTLGVIDSPANQTGYGVPFPATWTVPAGDLIQGVAPISATTSTNSFRVSSCAGVPVLTDGNVGFTGGGNNSAMASAGSGSSTGRTLTYSLPASAFGYNITSVEVFGGWNDNGRDEQVYKIYTAPFLAPSAYSEIINFDYKPYSLPAAPVGAVPNMTRVIYTPASGPYLAYNATNLLLDFTKNGGASGTTAGGENGWQGYSEIAVYGTPAPALVAGFLTNIVPSTALDVVGSSVTMYCAAFGSSLTYQWQANYGGGFVPVTGTTAGGITSSNLVLSNLQLGDAGTYQLVITSGATSVASLPCVLTVNPDNGPDAYNVVEAVAYQNGNGIFATFSPTWSIAPGSLIAGKTPVAVTPGINNFTTGTVAGLPALTDGTFGFLGTGSGPSVAACGSTAGQTVTYALTGSQSGYDLTNITVYGGWNDAGRDEQAYTISYSTVLNPTVFTVLVSYDILPSPNPAVPNYQRVSYTSGTASPLASDVAYLKFDFTTPNGGGENGYEGYAELSVYGTASAAVTVPPYVSQQTLPSSGFDVVGGTVGFTAAFNSSGTMTFQWQVDTGSGPAPVSGARFLGAQTTALTITNLQLADTGSYSCVATVSSGPAAGTATSTPSPFVVSAAPAPVGGVVAAEAGQTWSGVSFTPTWTVTPGSIIAGTLPTSTSTAASFTNSGCGGLPVLTDGLIGPVGGGSLQCFAAGGTTPAGSNVTYTLGGAGSTYDLSSIVVYGGWQDAGRDEQSYTISYSTAAAPATFITLETLNHTAPLTGVPNSTRMTFTPGTGAFLANNVAAVRINFASPSGQENGWQGYSEIDIYGVPIPTVNLPTLSGGNLNLTGTGGNPGGGYTCLTSTNVAAPLSTWTTNSQGNFNGSGAFSIIIPVGTSPPAQYFQIRVP